ncbi:MAG: hypothetical protein WCR67_06090 [Bacilli bacterium]
MSEKHIQDFDPSTIGFKTFKEREAMVEKRELPALSKAEKITSLVLYILGGAIALTAIIVILCYALNDAIRFSGDGGYGIIGIIAMILTLGGIIALCAVNGKYHLVDIEKKDHRLAKSVKIAVFYFVIGAIFTAYAFIWMRSNITGRVTWPYLNIVMLVGVWIACIAGMILNFRHDEKDGGLTKIYNFLFILLILWLPVCNYPILASSIVNIKVACWLVIFAPITMDLGLFFYNSRKKVGMNTAWQITCYLALAQECVALFYYAMFVAKQVNSL